MADYLYVCQFSNGHIKVGRSAEPTSRILTHADRAACFGITLVANCTIECVGPSAPREAALIARCAAAASARHLNEWFAGLEYSEVRKWAEEAAWQDRPESGPQDEDHDAEAIDFKAVVASLTGAGLTQGYLAAICGCDQSCISDIANGRTKDPRHSIGAALLRMRDRRTSVKAGS